VMVTGPAAGVVPVVLVVPPHAARSSINSVPRLARIRNGRLCFMWYSSK
jgi:hypothetical protein